MLSIVANQIFYPEVIIRSTISITSNLITSATYLNSLIKSNSKLQNLLNLNDIIEEIGIIKSFIEEMEEKKQHSRTLHICIENLRQILSELEINVNSITYKIENHKNLWFNYIRSFDIDNESKVIPILKEKMKQRFEILIKISSVI